MQAGGNVCTFDILVHREDNLLNVMKHFFGPPAVVKFVMVAVHLHVVSIAG